MERVAKYSGLDRAAQASVVAAGGGFLVLAGVYAGWLASRGSFGKEVIGLLLLAVAALAFSVSPNVFLGLVLLVVGTESISEAHPLAFGGAQVYSLDVLLGIVLLRAVLSREREQAPARLGDVTRLLFAIWASVVIAAGVRGVTDGYSLVSSIRLGAPLLYAWGFYVGLGRVVRERGFVFERTIRILMVVALALVAYMVLARITNTPFEDETNPTVGHLGTVITTSGVLRRDYGLASAFILYPALGIAGIAYLLNSARRTALAAAVAGIGVLATFLTLIRGEVFGLVLGLAVIVVLRAPASGARVSRATAVVAGTVAILVASLALWVVSPATARGVIERSLPGVVRQTVAADQTAKFRENAVRAGVTIAKRHPAGIGFVPENAVALRSGVDTQYIAHSGFTAMAVYTGWVGCVAAVLFLLGLLHNSFALPRTFPWLHPFFVGSLLMMAFYTVFGAAGLFGQGWVTALAALIAAVRFNAAGSHT